MKKIFPFIICALFNFYNNILPQNLNHHWTIINNHTFIDTSNILLNNDEIYVWVMEKHPTPIKIEMVDKEISKTKTYYLINRTLKKYSILQIIYYDKNDNVIKSFLYNYEWDKPELKYSTPILENSMIVNIFLRCNEIMDEKNKSQ